MSNIKLTKSVGMILLSIWLILTGLFSLFHVNIAGLYLIMAILAIATGVVILLGL
ncbi:MAG TPA: hypothetical protein VF399_11455 [bacterium]